MICSPCGMQTAASPCAHCGGDPLLVGRYRLERVLGRGSSGVTCAATRLVDGVTVAVKEMPLRLGISGAEASKARELVEREVRVLRELRHPQIPAHIEDFVTGAGKSAALHLVQEFVDGEDLAREAIGHRYSEDEVVELLLGVVPVLVYLHGLSPPVIHRDVKPRNVMRRAGTGRAEGLVLLDFGAVRDAVVDKELGGSTVAGTFGYMAPEQFRGDASPATDIYGLGALAVALLTRREPHTLADGSGNLAWRAHANVSAGFAAVLDRMLARDPTRRPTASALREELERLRTGPDQPGTPTPARSNNRAANSPAAIGPAASPSGPSGPRPRPVARDAAAGEAFATPLDLPELPAMVTAGSEASASPGQLPVARGGLGGLARGSRGPGPAGLMVGAMLIGLGGSLAVGVAGAVLVAERAEAPSPTSAPKAAPTPTGAVCAVGRPHIASGPTVSGFAFVGGKPDGSEVALALVRQSDKRAEVILYEAGSRTTKAEQVLKPSEVPDGFEDAVTAVLRLDGLPDLASPEWTNPPRPVDWCQSGDEVLIDGSNWHWNAVEDSCALGLRSNASFALCPDGVDPGGPDGARCIRPSRLEIGCSDVAPRLVDVYEQGHAVWVVAERPGSTTPRFAGGVLTEP